MELVDVVGVRSYGTGSQYLLIPKALAQKLGLKDGDKFACYEDGDGIHYLRTRPNEAEKQVASVEVEQA